MDMVGILDCARMLHKLASHRSTCMLQLVPVFLSSWLPSSLFSGRGKSACYTTADMVKISIYLTTLATRNMAIFEPQFFFRSSDLAARQPIDEGRECLMILLILLLRMFVIGSNHRIARSSHDGWRPSNLPCPGSSRLHLHTCERRSQTQRDPSLASAENMHNPS